MSKAAGADTTKLEFTMQGRTATATVRPFPGGWYSVEHNDYQVSVAPDGLIHLARHISPEQAEDFVGALLAAREVAAKIVAERGAGVPVGPGLKNSAGQPVRMPSMPVIEAESPRKALPPSPQVINRAKAVKAHRAAQG